MRVTAQAGRLAFRVCFSFAAKILLGREKGER